MLKRSGARCEILSERIKAGRGQFEPHLVLNRPGARPFHFRGSSSWLKSDPKLEREKKTKVIEIEAIDMFVESDPTGGDDDEGTSLISLRVPSDREFARQIKELGAKWDDTAKEWRIIGGEQTIKQIGALCKAAFPRLPRRRDRLVATQVSTSEGNSWVGSSQTGPDTQNGTEDSQNRSRQVELIVRVEFMVNRTLKTYRYGQNLKWVKQFQEFVELPEKNDQPDNLQASSAAQADYLNRLRSEIRELEGSATQAFEALLLGRKAEVAAILKEAGMQQL
jgi:hypothetical protein